MCVLKKYEKIYGRMEGEEDDGWRVRCLLISQFVGTNMNINGWLTWLKNYKETQDITIVILRRQYDALDGE
jgi:hypothetical protein